MSTFVSVGNATQPFPRLLRAVATLAPLLPQPVFVQYGAARDFACAACEGTTFIGMEDFATRVATARLLILHAGAGSVIHAARAGKVPVLVPRRAALGEHVDDHQVEFARELGQLGKAVVCEDVQQLATAVTRALRLQAAVLPAAEPPMAGLLRDLLRAHARSLQHD